MGNFAKKFFEDYMRKFSVFIAFLAACLWSGAFAKDFYLAGGFNGWNPNDQSCKFEENNGAYTLFMESLSGDFKITTYDWSEQFGCASTIEYGNTYPCVQSDNGYNIVLPDDPATDITITFDYNNKTVRFDKSETLYLVGDFNDWLTLPAYAFTLGDDGLYTLRTENFSGRFKIASQGYKYNFGMGGEVVLGGEHAMSHDGADMTFAGAGSRLLITLNPDSTDSGAASALALPEDCDCAVEYYNLQGIRVSAPAHGIYIRRCGDKLEKIRVQ